MATSLIVFAVGVFVGVVISCICASGSYAKGHEDGYQCAWNTKRIVDKVQ